MKERNIIILNMLVFSLLSFLTAGFQTSFWPTVLKFLSGANLWIFISIYIFTYRHIVHSLIFAYMNTLFLHTFTSLPFGILLTLQIILLFACYFLRSRIFWTTSSYFLIISAVCVLLYEIAFLVLSYFFEPLPAQHLAWRETLITLLLTPIIGLIFFSVGRFIDSLLPPPQLGTTRT
jgi:hypothetical protein